MPIGEPPIIASDPVTESGIPIRNLWYMLLYAWDAYRYKQRFDVDALCAPTLDALLSRVLTELIEQRLRIGLQRDYIPTESMVAGIRGRINFCQSIRRFSFQQGKAYCHYNAFSANTSNNQIIRSTLARVAKIGDFGPVYKTAEELRSKIRRVVQNLEGINLIALNPEQIQLQRFKRVDGDYSLMLAICQLIHLRMMPTEDAGEIGLPGIDRDSMTMHQVFETFVARFFKVHLEPQWIVGSQQKIDWQSDESHALLPSMFLDVSLQHRVSKTLIYLDTKFTKQIVTSGRFGKEVFDRSHLFQIYSYLRSQEDRSASHRSATGIVLYPAAKLRLSESVRIQGHSIQWETIDLALPWEQIEENLTAIPNAVPGIRPSL